MRLPLLRVKRHPMKSPAMSSHLVGSHPVGEQHLGGQSDALLASELSARAQRRSGYFVGCSRRSFLKGAASVGITAFLSQLSLMGLTACVNQHPKENTSTTSKNSELAAGYVLDPTITRVIATTPASVDLADRLNLNLVGIPQTARTIPARYQDLPIVGAPMSPDMEIVKSLNPDLLISPNTLQEDLQPKYAAAGIPCIFADLKSVEGLYNSLDYVGRKFGLDDLAAKERQTYQDFLKDFEARHTAQNKPKVLVLMGVPGSYIVATDKSYSGSLVKMAGSDNVYDSSITGSQADFLNANTEDMLTRDPDIILRTAHALPKQVMQMFAKEFETNDIWKHFRAVQENRVYDLSYDHFGMSAGFNYPEALEEVEPYLFGNA